MGKWYGGRGCVAANAYGKTMRMRPVRYNRPRRPPFKGAKSAPRQSGRSRQDLRSGRSYTKTKTKQKRKTGGVSKTGDNSSVSYCRLGRSLKGSQLKFLVKKVLGKQVVSNNTSGTITSTAGVQAIKLFTVMDASQLISMQNVASTTVTENDVKLFVGNVKHRVVFKNQSNNVGKVTIYDIMTKRSPPTAALDDPVECWNKGFLDLGVGAQSTVIDNTPFNSAEFKQYWKVNKVTTFNCEPGQQHEHTIRQGVNSYLSSTRWANSAAQSISGITSHCMIVFHGSIGHESTTNLNVTYMPMKLDWVQFKEYDFGYTLRTIPQYFSTNLLSTTVANFNFMGENQDYDAVNIES